MKIYIAGAITNNPNYREQFKQTEERLTAKGHTVINPCKNEGFTYREYINMGLCELMHCDAIYMLSGWESSVGAKLEYEYAKAVELRIIYQRADNALINADWEKAVGNVETVKEIACMFPAASLCMPYLKQLLKRYESGERTKELYELMLAVH